MRAAYLNLARQHINLAMYPWISYNWVEATKKKTNQVILRIISRLKGRTETCFSRRVALIRSKEQVQCVEYK